MLAVDRDHEERVLAEIESHLREEAPGLAVRLDHFSTGSDPDERWTRRRRAAMVLVCLLIAVWFAALILGSRGGSQPTDGRVEGAPAAVAAVMAERSAPASSGGEGTRSLAVG
ncbi:DUF3040 domain-containing protein [Streptomyces sp. NPDC090036]|uniref:DUF3040 domain-containing protein n=1 Tax=Streptomyces sp. NPDC090036 TaxID=3365926 RepID=UPI0037F62D06